MTATNHVEILWFDVRSEWPWTIRQRGRGSMSTGSKISYGRRASIKASGGNALMSVLPACSSCRNEWNKCGRGKDRANGKKENQKASREMVENEKHWVRRGSLSHTRTIGAFPFSGFYCWNEWFEIFLLCCWSDGLVLLTEKLVIKSFWIKTCCWIKNFFCKCSCGVNLSMKSHLFKVYFVLHHSAV